MLCAFVGGSSRPVGQGVGVCGVCGLGSGSDGYGSKGCEGCQWRQGFVRPGDGQGALEDGVDVVRRVVGRRMDGQPPEVATQEGREGRHRPQGEADGAALDHQIGPGGQGVSNSRARLDCRPVQGDAGPVSAGQSVAGVLRCYEYDLQLAVYPGKQGELPIQPLLARDAECRVRVDTQVAGPEPVVMHFHCPFSLPGAVITDFQPPGAGTMSADRPDPAMARSRI